MNEQDELLKAKLNRETGQLTWAELQRHFAHGSVIKVEKGVDLVDMAFNFFKDNQQTVSSEIESGDIIRATDDHARDWQKRDPLFWAIVVTPWVLVQEITPEV